MVAEHIGDEFVDLVTSLIRHTHEDGSGGFLRCEHASSPAIVIFRRVEEPVEERNVVV